MELEDEAGGCKGKIGKKGNEWLIENGATEESCTLACLEHKGCKFATLQKRGAPRKWKCASFKKCKKMKKSAKFITFKKSKAKAPKPSPNPSPKPGTIPELPDVAPLRDAKTERNGFQSMSRSYTEPPERFFPSGPVKWHGEIPAGAFTRKTHRRGTRESFVTSTTYTSAYSLLGEPVKSKHFSSLIAAGASPAGGEVAWPVFVTHAVGLQFCAARSDVNLDEAFLSWLGQRPEVLLSLAATTYPVQSTVWENMQRLWEESELRAEAERNLDFADAMVGFAYKQRRVGIDYPIDYEVEAAGSRGDPQLGRSDTLPDGRPYGWGKMNPTYFGIYEQATCPAGRFPDRDPHPKASEALKYQIKVGATHHPWPLIPYGYYAPIKECEWAKANPSRSCPYNMDLFNWKNPPHGPICKQSDWFPVSLPRISEDGRVCGGCSYYSMAKLFCLHGKIGGVRKEPGHGADC